MQKINLTDSEWKVMECFWDSSPRTVMQVVEYLKGKYGWAKSTGITMLSRMEKKGLLECDASGKAKIYSTSIRREDAVLEETKTFLDKVYNGSVGLMMSSMVDNCELSQKEIDELYDILKKAKGR